LIQTVNTKPTDRQSQQKSPRKALIAYYFFLPEIAKQFDLLFAHCYLNRFDCAEMQEELVLSGFSHITYDSQLIIVCFLLLSSRMKILFSKHRPFTILEIHLY
jgi:hypothetical protein